ncbi:hypothetical protein FK529_04700 [Tsukamurella asaccharolytica]|uniref:Uncharacterized protein n=1 Tax=Tsukamurella asaccharolytica TaxID=2592067 RepID=A0A5C5RCT2_9ACTN|nr:hypothetical protein [Tsukamurella asaccharolytica]TWS20646.1 hypothetical protein FK529_04700 [Tsukamurella asaccharolytica]
MARSVGPSAATTARGLLAGLVEHWDSLIGTYGDRVDVSDGCFVAPWPEQIERVEAGRPVVVTRVELTAACRLAGLPVPPAGHRFRVDADGRITRLA